MSQCFPDLLRNIFLCPVRLDLHNSVLIEVDDLHAMHKLLSTTFEQYHRSLRVQP